MAFPSVIAALAGLGFFSNAVSQGYSGQGFGIGILLAILVFIGTWGLYWDSRNGGPLADRSSSSGLGRRSN